MLVHARSGHAWSGLVSLLCAAIFALVGALLGATPAAAQVPSRVPFQGLLLDAGGAPINDAVDLDFELFDALTNGNSLWSESHPGVIVVDGVYSVDLGSSVPLGSAVLAGGAAFLEITVSGETLVPRQQLLAVPYSLVSENVGSVSSLILEQIIQDFPFDGQEPGNLDPSEGTGDTDGDGLANFLDPDNDNDGISDAAELVEGKDINLVSPSISNVSPSTLVGYCESTLVVTGANFATLASVGFGAEAPIPSGSSGTQFSVDVTAPTSQSSLPLSVVLANGESDLSAPIAIQVGTTSISGVEPVFAEAGVGGTLTISGSGFCDGTSVSLGSQTLEPASLTSSELTVAYAPEAVGETTLSVHHPNGAMASRPFAFTLGNPRSVFVTNSLRQGDFGSVAAADAICQSEASAAGLLGTYRAWLSNSLESGTPSSPATTFDLGAGPYVRIDGAIVADDWADLTDGTLNVPINVTPSGSTITSGYVWTGTLVDGTAASTAPASTCDEWTNTGADARAGAAPATNSAWTNLAFPSSCSASWRLYCFQQ